MSKGRFSARAGRERHQSLKRPGRQDEPVNAPLATGQVAQIPYT
jgi:hypothetical protein